MVGTRTMLGPPPDGQAGGPASTSASNRSSGMGASTASPTSGTDTTSLVVEPSYRAGSAPSVVLRLSPDKPSNDGKQPTTSEHAMMKPIRKAVWLSFPSRSARLGRPTITTYHGPVRPAPAGRRGAVTRRSSIEPGLERQGAQPYRSAPAGAFSTRALGRDAGCT